MELAIHHDPDACRFTVTLEGLTAFLLYAPAGDRILDFQSTFVPHALRGQGIGMRLVRHALDHARAHGLSVIPSCWFVKLVTERHREYQDLLR